MTTLDPQAARERCEAARRLVATVVETGEWPEDNVEGWEFMGKVADALDDLPAILEALKAVDDYLFHVTNLSRPPRGTYEVCRIVTDALASPA